jgi:uncharacterized protein (TIGR02302 family)
LRDRQPRRYEWPLRLAQASLLWERMWPRLWPVLGIAGTFVAIALLDVLPALPPALHTLVLFVLVAALAVALRNAVIGLQPVHRRDARHRLERDSGLSHHPLTALEDNLLAGSGDPAAQALWSRHVKQMAAATRRLRVRLPAPGMAGIEPHGLRVIVVLALIIGLVAAGDHAGARLKRAVTPHLVVPPIVPAAIDVWVTPPAYTGMAPLFLKVPDAAEAEVIRIPAGSTVLAQVYGVAAPPRLLVGGERSDFASLGTAEGGTGYRAEVDIHSGDRLAIRAGLRTLASWPIEVVPDKAPEVQFTALPDATADGLLRVGYEAVDDYGIAAVTAVIRHGDDNGIFDGEDGVRVSMPLANPGASAVEGQSQHDLTFHQWAGLEVSIRLEAEDAAGQIGLSSAVSVVLPERSFSHPVARAVIEQRKRLIDENVTTRESVASRLEAIGARPNRFARDVVVSLALAVGRSRLLYDEDAEAVASVRSILWDTALRIEQGTLPAAEQRLSEARDRLQDALRSDASGEEIDMLADELQQALNAYLEALATELARQGIAGSPPIPMGQSMQGQDLQDIVEMARQLARAGARDRARDLLAELQHLLDGVRSSFNAGVQAAEDLAEAGRLLSELEDLTLKQENLLNSTFEALRRSGTDAPEGSSPSGSQWEPTVGAAEQNALRGALEDLTGRIDDLVGSVPAPLGEAEHAMGDAAAALRAQHLAAAVSDQTRAVEKLRAAAETSARMMVERLGGTGGMLVIQPGGNSWGSGDPFGRFGTEGLRGLGIGDVEVPDGAQMRYVEEIVRELRRRAGDHQRPQLERDYIERLLRRF